MFLCCVCEPHDGKSYDHRSKKPPLAATQAFRDLLVARASDCHLFDGVKFLCGKNDYRCEKAHKHFGFEENVAVVYGLVSWVSDVGRCEMFKNLLFNHKLL